MTTWEYASSKLGSISNKARSVAREIFDAAQAAGHDVWFMWGNGSEPDHVYNQQGRPVLDFMVRNEAAGDWVRNYIWNHRSRLGLKHVIWEQNITSTVVQPGVRRKMADRGNRTANHFDHVHGEWFAGEYKSPEPARKTNEQLAAEVWRGDWGNGDDRRRRLTAAGYDYAAVQALVNKGVGRNPNQGRKSVSQLATEVIRGEWGNGEDRRRRLTNAGYDYAAVQREVNRRV